jgi:hypothetical protein
MTHAPLPLKYGLKPFDSVAVELLPSSVHVPSQATTPATTSSCAGWLVPWIQEAPYVMRVVQGGPASAFASANVPASASWPPSKVAASLASSLATASEPASADASVPACVSAPPSTGAAASIAAVASGPASTPAPEPDEHEVPVIRKSNASEKRIAR